MILSMVIDMLQTNLRQLGWAYYVFADRCRTNGWRCAVEQKYLTWQLTEQDKSDLTGAQAAWDYSFMPDLSSIQNRIDPIPQGIFDSCYQKYGLMSIYHLLTESWMPLETYLDNLLDKYAEQGETVEAIVIYPKAPYSIQKVAKKKKIALFVLEVGPMRWPIYTGSAYFSHFDQLSTDQGECKSLYNRFMREWKREKYPILSREQILALYLEKDYLCYLRYQDITPTSEALLIGNGMMSRADLPHNWGQTMYLADQLRSKFGQSITFRPDGRDPYQAHFGMEEEQYSQESPNIVSLLRAKRAVCAGSNMLFEAMLWNRPVYCDTKDHALYFICNHTDDWKDALVPETFLNFYALVYLAPMEIATQDDYVRWRVSEPSMQAIYDKHLTHYLKRWGLTKKQVFEGDEQDRVSCIIKAKNPGIDCLKEENLPKGEAAWEALRTQTHYELGPIAVKLIEQKQREEAAQARQAKLEATIAQQEEAAQAKQAELEANIAQQEEAAQARQAELEATIAQQEEAAQARQAELEATIAQQEEAARARQAELEATIAQQEEAAQARQAELEATIAQQEEAVQARQTELETERGEKASLQAANNALQIELDTFFHSHSWRITKPLRWLAHVVYKDRIERKRAGENSQMGIIRKIGQKHESVMFAGKIFRRGFSRDFRHYVVQYGAPSTPPVVTPEPPMPEQPAPPPYLVPNGVEDRPGHRVFHWEVHELGELNEGKIVLYLANDLGHGGFCGLWIYYLNRLSFADRMGMAMCINTYHSTMYQEPEPYRGNRNNVFEYYFEQPGGISVDDALHSRAVIYDWNNPEFGFDDFFHVGGSGDYLYKPEDIEAFSKVNKKYIRFQPDVKARLEKDIKQLNPNAEKIIGVHARGTDYKIGYKGHPTAVTTEMYIAAAEEAMKSIGAKKVFLATDDKGILEEFKKHFGGKVLYFEDVIRSEGTVWNCEFDQDRPHHRFNLGYEILRDTYVLGSGDGLICGLSYVGFMAQVIKKSKDEEYEYFTCINPGLNAEGIDLTSKNARDQVRAMWEKAVKKQNEK